MASTTLLIDGDQYCYKVAAALEKAVDWGDGIHTLHADDREGRELLEHMLEDLRQTLDARRMVICLTSNEYNFRRDVYPQYKEHRAGHRKPMILSTLREHLKERYAAREIPGLEADDIMGIIATRPQRGRSSETYVLVTDDKDLLQIPGQLYRPARHDEGILRTDVEAASRFFFHQVLVGDRADNYPGCPSIGEARARRILDGAEDGDLWGAVVAAYEAVGQTEEDAITQARCARILQATDFDFKLRRHKLWHPGTMKTSKTSDTRSVTASGATKTSSASPATQRGKPKAASTPSKVALAGA